MKFALLIAILAGCFVLGYDFGVFSAVTAKDDPCHLLILSNPMPECKSVQQREPSK